MQIFKHALRRILLAHVGFVTWNFSLFFVSYQCWFFDFNGTSILKKFGIVSVTMLLKHETYKTTKSFVPNNWITHFNKTFQINDFSVMRKETFLFFRGCSNLIQNYVRSSFFKQSFLSHIL